MEPPKTKHSKTNEYTKFWVINHICFQEKQKKKKFLNTFRDPTLPMFLVNFYSDIQNSHSNFLLSEYIDISFFNSKYQYLFKYQGKSSRYKMDMYLKHQIPCNIHYIDSLAYIQNDKNMKVWKIIKPVKNFHPLKF